MKSARIIYHLARADFLERVRRYSFLVMVGLVVFLGYQTAIGNMALELGKYRGEYNSAWVGAMMSLIAAFFLGWFGVHRFYLGRWVSGFLMLALNGISWVLHFVLIGFLGFAVLGLWWLIDALLIPSMTRSYNERLIDRIVSVRIAEGDWAAAADALRRFVSQAPGHLPALARLVDVCVDGGLQPAIFEAQGLLADAYLATGAASEAKYVAEDLLTRQPWEPAHFARLRAALEACGEADPDRALADWLAGTPAFGLDEEFHAETAPVDPGAGAGEPGAPALFEPDAPPEPAGESEPSLALPDPWTTPLGAGGVPQADLPPSPPVPPPVKTYRLPIEAPFCPGPSN